MSGEDPIALCLAGRISPEVALARLALAGHSPERIAARLTRCGTQEGCGDRASTIARRLAEHAGGIVRLQRLVVESGLDHAPGSAAPDAELARLREAFDRAVACSPEAAVAAYSLGDPAILDAATLELVEWLAAENLIGRDRDVLDLGCGIGRVAATLAPRCRFVLGLDISPGMIAEARRRHAAGNLRFEITQGADLSGWPDAAFDLVLAVDTFPYLMQVGAAAAERHVAEAARLLRPGGCLAILNLSYGRGLNADRVDAARWAGNCGLALSQDGAAPFSLWDATAFVLHRPA